MIDSSIKDIAEIAGILSFMLYVGKFLFSSGKDSGSTGAILQSAIQLLEARLTGKLDAIDSRIGSVDARLAKLEDAKIEQRVIALEERTRDKSPV